jgi:hypothetical protein
MKFALRNKTPNERPEHLQSKKKFVQGAKDHILNTLGIAHTAKTLVGNEFVRGVSGGERKRVSIAEVMAGQVTEQQHGFLVKRILISSLRVLFNSGITQLEGLILVLHLNLLVCCEMKPTETRKPS